MRLRDHLRSRLLTREPEMDLNYLYHRRGQSLFMAARASCDRSRDAHLGLARIYLDRIAKLRRARRAEAA